MKQLMIFVNSQRCVGCHACETACKMENDLPAGPKWIKVRSVEFEQAPGVWRISSRPIRCAHCGDSPCERVCPVKAIKRTVDGIIKVDPEKCIGCKLCLLGCPFCIPSFNSHQQLTKCNFCLERIKKGLKPACVQACPVGALVYEDASSLSSRVRRHQIQNRVDRGQKQCWPESP